MARLIDPPKQDSAPEPDNTRPYPGEPDPFNWRRFTKRAFLVIDKIILYGALFCIFSSIGGVLYRIDTLGTHHEEIYDRVLECRTYKSGKIIPIPLAEACDGYDCGDTIFLIQKTPRG